MFHGKWQLFTNRKSTILGMMPPYQPPFYSEAIHWGRRKRTQIYVLSKGGGASHVMYIYYIYICYITYIYICYIYIYVIYIYVIYMFYIYYIYDINVIYICYIYMLYINMLCICYIYICYTHIYVTVYKYYIYVVYMLYIYIYIIYTYVCVKWKFTTIYNYIHTYQNTSNHRESQWLKGKTKGTLRPPILVTFCSRSWASWGMWPARSKLFKTVPKGSAGGTAETCWGGKAML